MANSVIIDNAPFESLGPEDGIATGTGINFALNFPDFIDIPYAIYSFGGASSVATAVLQLSYLGPFGGSGPAEIKLYVGSDASGVIELSDRFMGTALDTFTYVGGEIRSIDVTAAVNAALASGQSFAIRLEATVRPASLTSYYGGQFDTPSIEYRVGPSSDVPAPASIALLAMGLAGLTVARRKA